MYCKQIVKYFCGLHLGWSSSELGPTAAPPPPPPLTLAATLLSCRKSTQRRRGNTCPGIRLALLAQLGASGQAERKVGSCALSLLPVELTFGMCLSPCLPLSSLSLSLTLFELPSLAFSCSFFAACAAKEIAIEIMSSC